MSTEITNDEIQEVLEYCERATPGPWRNEHQVVADENSVVVGDETYNWRFVAHTNSDIEEGSSTAIITPKEAEANAEFIERARTDLPRLARALQEAQQRIKELEGL